MSRRDAVLRLVALLVVVAAAVALTRFLDLPSLAELRTRVDALGWWGGPVFAGVYAVATLSPLPKTVFTLAAGALFGVVTGLVVVVTGASLGAVLAFLIARAVGRDGVARLVGRHGDRLHAEIARRGFLTILVARLVPVVPFTAVNYLAGLTALPLRVFLAATVLGILPATTAYVVLGASGSEPGRWPFWVALAALGLLTAAGGLAAWRERRRRGQPLSGPAA